MKYTFKDEDSNVRSVDIDDAELAKLQRSIGGTQQEAIELWLFDHGYEDNDVVNELTEKAKANKCGPAVGGKKHSKPRKPRAEDKEKRDLVDWVFTAMLNNTNCTNIGIENPERVVTFSIGKNNYSLTLTRHRNK